MKKILKRSDKIPGSNLTYKQKLKKSGIKKKKIKGIKEVSPGYFKIEFK